MEEESLRILQRTSGKLETTAHCQVAMFAFLFGNDDQLAKSMAILQRAVKCSFGGFDASLVVLLDGLVATRNARISERRRNLRRACKQMQRMRQWALHAPHTYLCRQNFVEAEIAAVTGDCVTVYSKYVTAISLASDSGFIFIAALGNELSGKYYLFERNDEIAAWPFLREALRWYELWGAKVKADHLAIEIQRATGKTSRIF